MDKQVSSRSFNSFDSLDLYRIQVRELRGYAMFTLDPQGNILTWNAGVECLLGYAEHEWVGQHASIIFVPEDACREVCEAEMRQSEESGFCHRHPLAAAKRRQPVVRQRLHECRERRRGHADRVYEDFER